jgi:hypothetical protein
MRLDSVLKKVVPNISRPKKSRHFLMKLSDNFQMSEHSWPCRFHIIWNAYNIYMNCHTYQHFHMFLFHTITGRIFSTLINTTQILPKSPYFYRNHPRYYRNPHQIFWNSFPKEIYNIVLVFYDGFIQISLCMCTVGMIY